MNIKSLIFHKINKEQYSNLVTSVERPNLVSVNNTSSLLVTNILDSYRKDGGNSAASFKTGDWFPSKLQNLLDNNIDFLQFSKDSLNELIEKIKEETLATGGFFLLSHYEDGNPNEDYLLVALLKNKPELGINEALELQDMVVLNIDHLHFAAKINITKWQQANQSSVLRYVSFLKGKTRSDEIVGYFRKFLGIDNNTFISEVQDTKTIILVIKNYLKDLVDQEIINEEESRRLTTAVYDFAYERATNQTKISTQEIASTISPDDAQRFITFLNGQAEFNISDAFIPDKRALAGLKKHRIGSRRLGYNLVFDLDAIENGHIVINTDGNIVLIGEVPEDIKSLF